jgi:hypothetical protein
MLSSAVDATSAAMDTDQIDDPRGRGRITVAIVRYGDCSGFVMGDKEGMP